MKPNLNRFQPSTPNFVPKKSLALKFQDSTKPLKSVISVKEFGRNLFQNNK